MTGIRFDAIPLLAIAAIGFVLLFASLCNPPLGVK